MKPEVTFDDLMKLELKVGQILNAVYHPNADKLLVLQVDLGTETRQIITNIKAHYDLKDLFGKKIVVITNLPPREMRGYTSNGMLFGAYSGEQFSLLTLDRDLPAGAEVL